MHEYLHFILLLTLIVVLVILLTLFGRGVANHYTFINNVAFLLFIRININLRF